MRETRATLMHYHSAVVTLDHNYDYTDRHPRGDKPTGFWVSVLGEDDWHSWCMSEEFAPESLAVPHTVTLADDANILRIESAAELIAFDRDYGVPREYASAASYRFDIDWKRLYREYDGIVIAPYQWSQRLDGPSWYYTWDCASGCIWNLEAIAALNAQQVSA